MERFLALVTLALLGAFGPVVFAQTPTPSDSDAVRVNITINPDQSRTTYEFHPAEHKATGTTTEPNGKLRGRVEYMIDENSRFTSGEVFGPDGRFRFKTLYKSSAQGRILEETQRGADNSFIARIVYSYDVVGKQLGFNIFDEGGKRIGGTLRPSPTPTSSTKPHRIGH